jgi:hypothetical protein
VSPSFLQFIHSRCGVCAFQSHSLYVSTAGLERDLYRTACAIVLVLPVSCDVLTVLKLDLLFKFSLIHHNRAEFAVIELMANSRSGLDRELAHILTATLANPYSTPYPTSYFSNPPLQRLNPQGYSYSSTYNPLAVSSTPSTSFNHVSSHKNTQPSRGAPLAHWYTPGKNRCTYSTCTFMGSAQSVEIHMMDRHLIYPPGGHTRKRQPDWDADPSLKGYVLVYICIKLGMCAGL